MSPDPTGLEKAEQESSLYEWLDEEGHKAYHIPPEKRPKDAQ
jgi:hypothetical protein